MGTQRAGGRSQNTEDRAAASKKQGKATRPRAPGQARAPAESVASVTHPSQRIAPPSPQASASPQRSNGTNPVLLSQLSRGGSLGLGAAVCGYRERARPYDYEPRPCRTVAVAHRDGTDWNACLYCIAKYYSAADCCYMTCLRVRAVIRPVRSTRIRGKKTERSEYTHTQDKRRTRKNRAGVTMKVSPMLMTMAPGTGRTGRHSPSTSTSSPPTSSCRRMVSAVGSQCGPVPSVRSGSGHGG